MQNKNVCFNFRFHHLFDNFVDFRYVADNTFYKIVYIKNSNIMWGFFIEKSSFKLLCKRAYISSFIWSEF